MNRHHCRRRGLIVLIVMGLLIVIVMLMTLGLKSLAGSRLQSAAWRDRLTTVAWSEAGVSRLRAQVRLDPNYAGEVWEIPAADRPKHDQIVVTIQRLAPTGAFRIETQLLAAGRQQANLARTVNVNATNSQTKGTP